MSGGTGPSGSRRVHDRYRHARGTLERWAERPGVYCRHMVRRRFRRPERPSALGDSIKRAVAATLIREFRDHPEVAADLVEQGLIEPEYATADPASMDDPVAFVRDFGASLADRLRKQPSLLASLNLSALELLGQDAIGSSHAVATATREHLTVLFSDLEGFTSFTEEHGDEAATHLLFEHYGTVDGVASARGGTVVKRLGDGHLLSFPAAPAAVIAGLELVESAPAPLRLRVGAHGGEVMASADDLLGHVVNVASRVAAAATGGQELVTSAVRDPVGALEGIRFESIPARPLRGLEEAMALWAVHRT